MSSIERFIADARQLLPTMPITGEPEQLRDYTIDGVMPRLVVTPGTKEETAQAVNLAGQHGLTLLARGGGSRLNLGGIPGQVDILLETNRMTRLIEHEAPDLTCQVEAGITLAALQAQLATKGQRVALDPPDAEQASLGGILASNASGPKRLRYGTARDVVIGLRVVQANGEIARSGGNVVKNVAGYDLNKLYIGSLGTLGIIVEANLKLQPLPVAERTLLLTYPNADDAMQTVTALLQSQLTPSAIELIDAGAASDMTDFFGLDLPTEGYTLAIDFEGSPTAITRQLDETRLLARKAGALMGDDLDGPAQAQLWQAVREHMRGTVTCKVALLVSHVGPFLTTINTVCRAHRLEAAVIAHAGNGVLYVELRPGDAMPRLAEGIAELRRQAQEARGSLVIERCPIELKRRIDVWGEPGGEFYLMQRLKQQFDPKSTFVQGRYLGGL